MTLLLLLLLSPLLSCLHACLTLVPRCMSLHGERARGTVKSKRLDLLHCLSPHSPSPAPVPSSLASVRGRRRRRRRRRRRSPCDDPLLSPACVSHSRLSVFAFFSFPSSFTSLSLSSLVPNPSLIPFSSGTVSFSSSPSVPRSVTAADGRRLSSKREREREREQTKGARAEQG